MSQLEQLCGHSADVAGCVVHEVRMRDLERFAACVTDLIPEFSKGGGLSDFYFSDGQSIPDSVWSRCQMPLLTAAYCCADNLTDDADLIAVCEAVLLLNRAFFTHADDPRNKGGSGDWYDSFQYLVSTGHRHKDILDYPFSVFLGYCRAVNNQQARDERRIANAVRCGRFMDDRKFKAYLEAV